MKQTKFNDTQAIVSRSRSTQSYLFTQEARIAVSAKKTKTIAKQETEPLKPKTTKKSNIPEIPNWLECLRDN